MSTKENKNAVRESLKAALLPMISIDKEGKASIDKNAYVATLPADITEEQVKRVAEHNSTFYPAVTEAFGELAIDHMASHKKTNQVTLEVPLVGKDHFDVSITRDRTYPNPTGEGAPVQKWGVVGAQLHTHGARANRGEMNAVRDHLSALALEKLAKC